MPRSLRLHLHQDLERHPRPRAATSSPCSTSSAQVYGAPTSISLTPQPHLSTSSLKSTPHSPTLYTPTSTPPRQSHLHPYLHSTSTFTPSPLLTLHHDKPHTHNLHKGDTTSLAAEAIKILFYLKPNPHPQQTKKQTNKPARPSRLFSMIFQFSHVFGDFEGRKTQQSRRENKLHPHHTQRERERNNPAETNPQANTQTFGKVEVITPHTPLLVEEDPQLRDQTG